MDLQVARRGHTLKSAALIRMFGMPGLREPTLRYGKTAAGWSPEAIYNNINKTLNRFEGAVIQVVGTIYERGNQCQGCQYELGPFSHCVMVPGVTGCGNCNYRSKKDARVCSLNDNRFEPRAAASGSEGLSTTGPDTPTHGRQVSEPIPHTYRGLATGVGDVASELEDFSEHLNDIRTALQDTRNNQGTDPDVQESQRQIRRRDAAVATHRGLVRRLRGLSQ
jgi:hypothetical protein